MDKNSADVGLDIQQHAQNRLSLTPLHDFRQSKQPAATKPQIILNRPCYPFGVKDGSTPTFHSITDYSAE